MEETHDLEGPNWAVVTHDKALLVGVPHQDAVNFIRSTAPRLGYKDSDLTLVTTAVVEGMRTVAKDA